MSSLEIGMTYRELLFYKLGAKYASTNEVVSLSKAYKAVEKEHGDITREDRYMLKNGWLAMKTHIMMNDILIETDEKRL